MPRKPAKPPVFFIDRSPGRKQVVEALRAAGADAIAHDDVFDQNAKDVEWLEAAGERGWIVLTKDAKIRRNPYEREMVEHAAGWQVHQTALKLLFQ